jgi:thymidine phosphorylase
MAAAVAGLSRSPREAELDAVIRAAPSATDDDVALLAEKLAASGSVRPASADTADISSTGGPSSLSTLLCPLQLVTLGCRVPTVGVPGRPAGGIDVLAGIPGFRYRLERAETEAILQSASMVHCITDSTFAPTDGLLFLRRQATGAQQVPPLVIASLLAKKVAMGVGRAGLEVRVAAHGNLGGTWDEARVHAQRFCRVARLLGIDAVCFLTDASMPYQPHIGRGEALVALADIFDGSESAALARHSAECWDMACETSGVRRAPPSGPDLREVFERHLTAQGSSASAFIVRVEEVRRQEVRKVAVARDGYLGVDLGSLREVLVGLQAASHATAEFPDPAGVTLLRDAGKPVARGDIVAALRVPPGAGDEVVDRIGHCFQAVAEPPAARMSAEVVRS